jgi:hypothetical protein
VEYQQLNNKGKVRCRSSYANDAANGSGWQAAGKCAGRKADDPTAVGDDRSDNSENATHEPLFMSDELLSLVAYPAAVVCTHRGAVEGHEEVVWTCDDGEDYGGKKAGWEIWLCCHACRDANQPCETFTPCD